jgi:alcohol dehydrogenase
LINSTDVDPVSEILEISGGVDVSVDALGSAVTASAGINSLRRLGRHLQLGLLPSDTGTTALPIGRVIAYELTLLGSHGMAAIDYPKLLSMVASKTLHPELLVTSRIALAAGAIALANSSTLKVKSIILAGVGKQFPQRVIQSLVSLRSFLRKWPPCHR